MSRIVPEKIVDPSTEEKIKASARIVFHQKGYAATRTRDIAEAAGINLALLNYYFRSKEKLFDLIMLETMQQFMQAAMGVINDTSSTLDQKIRILVSNYIDLLIAEPDIPLFIMSEIKRDPQQLLNRMGLKDGFMQSVLVRQLEERAAHYGNTNFKHPLQFLMNLLGLTIFPFIANPLLRGISKVSQSKFNEMMLERKKLIPIWIENMLAHS